jgi:phage N-6-adenine-methyltransferase
MPKTMPRQKRGESRQDYATDRSFIDAVQARFGELSFDLAAIADNTVVPGAYFDEQRNSLSQSWHLISGVLWLNPPFSNIAPWARKCALEARQGARILFLTPASVGSDWFEKHVHRHAFVLALTSRLRFVGAKDPYPKDCMLSVYGQGINGFDTWKWR